MTACAGQCPCSALRSLPKGCGVTAHRIRGEDPAGDVFPLDWGGVNQANPININEDARCVR